MIKKLLFLVCYLRLSLIVLSQATINFSSGGTLSGLAEQAEIKVDCITKLKVTGSISCNPPEISCFKIKEIVPNDAWTVDVIFELDAINTELYRLTHDSYDYGYSKDFSPNPTLKEYTIKNVEKHFTNYFRLYAINSCNQESKVSEIVLEPVSTAVETNPIDSIEIKVLTGNLIITNSFDRNLSLKVYSVLGVCLLSKTLVSGKNEFSMQQWSNIAIIRIEDNGKVVLTKKILVR